MRRRRSPQEKKALSLRKDRRNAYGESDKASRKNIPRAKARVNRANRRADANTLTGARGARDAEVDQTVESTLEGRRRKFWRKSPDEPLGWKVARKNGEDPPASFDPSTRGS